LVLNFDPDDFSSKFQRRVDQDTVRLGTRYTPFPALNVIGSLFYSDRDEEFRNLFEQLPPAFRIDEAKDRKRGFKPELRGIFNSDRFNITIGGGFYSVDVEQDFFTGGISDSIEQTTVYSYTNVLFPVDILPTLGLSYDRYKEGIYEFDRVNPKLGLQWNVTDDVLLRAAAFKTVKSTQVFDQTIEPTQVAGFNQFFDDIDGAKSKFGGAGVDVRLTQDIYVGAEAFWREIDHPIFVTFLSGREKVFREDSDENNFRAYGNWAVSNSWVFGIELSYDWFKRSEEVIDAARPRPRRVETISVPISLRYFGPSGVFAGVSGTLVNQDVRRTVLSEDFAVSRNEEDDTFFVVDAFIGYRFPKRIGVISLEITNLLDSRFNFQDDNFRTSGATSELGTVRAPMYVPERAVTARLTLSF
jgi:hypothetical protein